MTVTLLDTTVRSLFHDAHTVYSFRDEPVDPEVLRTVYETAKWAPTGGNGQPLRVVFVASDAARARLVQHVDPGNVAKARSAPVTAILAMDLDWHLNLPDLQPYARDPHLGWQDSRARENAARFNATLQAGYFILAARASGLGVGPMGGFDRSGVDDDLLAGRSWSSLLLVNLGYPAADGTRPRMPRLSFDRAVEFA